MPSQPRSNALSNVLGISRLMVAESNLSNLLDLIMSKATMLTQAERSSLYLLDTAEGQLTTYVAQKVTLPRIRLPLGKGIAGHVAQTGEVINLRDAYDSDLFDPTWDKRTGFRTRSVLCVPMLDTEERVIGVLQVLNSAHSVFSREDASVLSVFASHASAAVENLRLRDDLRLAFRSGIRAMAEAVDARDPATAGHSERVTYYTVRIAQAMGMDADDVTALEYAATLHDIGKIGIRDDVLSKPDRLTDDEYRIIQRHADITRTILDKFYFTGHMTRVPEIAAAHHERLDGSGYPHGVDGADLALPARILAVADVYDAITAFDRPYRRAMSPEQAVEILREQAGEKLDGDVIDVFVGNQLYTIERRRFARIDADLFIEYRILPRHRVQDPTAVRGAEARNISHRGLLFATSDFIPVGSYLEVTIHLYGEVIGMLARAVRTERVGHSDQFEIGIMFLDLPDPTPSTLRNHLVDIDKL